jgi:hypothetical protein
LISTSLSRHAVALAKVGGNIDLKKFCDLISVSAD